VVRHFVCEIKLSMSVCMCCRRRGELRFTLDRFGERPHGGRGREGGGGEHGGGRCGRGLVSLHCRGEVQEREWEQRLRSATSRT
jgi:hypothetical protein